jgi:hypothetical protein
VLVAARIVAIVVVDPRGDFPLNDDWASTGSPAAIVSTWRDWLMGVPSVPQPSSIRSVWRVVTSRQATACRLFALRDTPQ